MNSEFTVGTAIVIFGFLGGAFGAGLFSGLLSYAYVLRSIRFQYRFVVTPEILEACIYPGDLSPLLVGCWAFYFGRPLSNDTILIEFLTAERTKPPTRALIPYAALPESVRHSLEKEGVIQAA